MRTKLLWAAAVVFGVLAVGEIVLQWGAYVEHRAMLEVRRSELGAYEVDPFLQVRPKVDSGLGVNKAGFRGDELVVSDSAFRVFVLGGGETFAADLAYADTYPAVVESILRERYPEVRVQVQNAAADWYTTKHSVIRYLFDIRELSPNLVVCMHGVGDLVRSFVSQWYCGQGATYRDDYGHFLGPLAEMVSEVEKEPYFPFRHLALRRVIGGEWGGPRGWSSAPNSGVWETREGGLVATPITHFPSIEPFRRNLTTLCGLLKADGVPIVLCGQPFIFKDDVVATSGFSAVRLCGENGRYPDAASLAHGLSSFNAVVAAVAKRNDASFVDLAGAIPRDYMYFSDDVRLTELGHEKAAVAIATHIAASGYIEKKFPGTTVRKGLVRRTAMTLLGPDEGVLETEVLNQDTKAAMGGSVHGAAAISWALETPRWGMLMQAGRSGVLSRVEIALRAIGEVKALYDVRVHGVAGGRPIGEPLVQAVLRGSDIPTEGVGVSVPFDSRLFIPAGTQFAVVVGVRGDSEGTGNNYVVWEGRDDSYGMGCNFYSRTTDGPEWMTHQRDLGLRTYTRPFRGQ